MREEIYVNFSEFPYRFLHPTTILLTFFSASPPPSSVFLRLHRRFFICAAVPLRLYYLHFDIRKKANDEEWPGRRFSTSFAAAAIDAARMELM